MSDHLGHHQGEVLMLLALAHFVSSVLSMSISVLKGPAASGVSFFLCEDKGGETECVTAVKIIMVSCSPHRATVIYLCFFTLIEIHVPVIAE